MVWRFDFVRKKTNIVNLDKEIIEMLEFYLDGTINNSTWRFQMFKKQMHKPEFYRLQNQQANPTQQQMPTPIIRRITCERMKELNENWRPFFHQKIQVWVKKTLELFHIFIIYPTRIFHYFIFIIHLTSIPTTPAKKPPAPPKVCKLKPN